MYWYLLHSRLLQRGILDRQFFRCFLYRDFLHLCFLAIKWYFLVCYFHCFKPICLSRIVSRIALRHLLAFYFQWHFLLLLNFSYFSNCNLLTLHLQWHFLYLHNLPSHFRRHFRHRSLSHLQLLLLNFASFHKSNFLNWNFTVLKFCSLSYGNLLTLHF